MPITEAYHALCCGNNVTRRVCATTAAVSSIILCSQSADDTSASPSQAKQARRLALTLASIDALATFNSLLYLLCLQLYEHITRGSMHSRQLFIIVTRKITDRSSIFIFGINFTIHNRQLDANQSFPDLPRRYTAVNASARFSHNTDPTLTNRHPSLPQSFLPGPPG